MNIEYSKEAQKRIKSHDKPTKERLKKAIEKIPKGDIIKLRGQDEYRLRIGDFRVLFTITGKTITIKNILPRGQAYKK